MKWLFRAGGAHIASALFHGPGFAFNLNVILEMGGSDEKKFNGISLFILMVHHGVCRECTGGVEEAMA
jgi:hypothetical protein